MRHVKRGGIFITFEGIEGSGKSTQIQALARWLVPKVRPRKVVVTREPGGTPLADRIRKTLLAALSTRMSPERELFLYEIARRDHVQEKIRPALERGDVVLCDRFTDATLAYQGYARGLPLKKIRRLNAAATGGLEPDLTFLLDLPVAAGLRRALKRTKARKKRLDRFDRESQRFHERVRAGYRALARREPKRIRVINADGKRNETFRSLCLEMERVLRGRL